jgi:thymidylate synthase ThyX
MIRRFSAHQLGEVNELAKKLFSSVKRIAPSIILFHEANDYDQKTFPELKKYAKKFRRSQDQVISKGDVELIDYDKNGDDKILASILFRARKVSFKKCLGLVKKMSRKEKLKLFKQTCQYLELYDTLLREFEFANLAYSLIVSAACFGQLKRHRIATLISQDYDPGLGFTIPKSIEKVDEKKKFREVIRKSEDVYRKIEKKLPGIGTYVLTNAHRKRVLLGINLRELYHISRLREDPTAQWDIRDKAYKMSKLAKKIMPVTTQLLGGKEDYPRIYHKLFGRNPKVTEVPVP